jgi:DNA-binding transcriptional MerR regulator
MTLQDLVDASGVPARTIRSWIDLGLVPRPSSSGPKATYPPNALARVLAVRALRHDDGASLSDIRRRLRDADEAEIAEIAAMGSTHAAPSIVASVAPSVAPAPAPAPVPAPASAPAPTPAKAAPSSAGDYLAELRARGVLGGGGPSRRPTPPTAHPFPPVVASPSPGDGSLPWPAPGSSSSSAAAPRRPEPVRFSPSTAPRARTYTAFRVGPSAELIVREPLSPDEIERWERIAHRIRAIIQGETP